MQFVLLEVNVDSSADLDQGDHYQEREKLKISVIVIQRGNGKRARDKGTREKGSKQENVSTKAREKGDL